MITKNCLFCKKEFESMPSAKRKFCSPRCFIKYQRGPNHPMYGKRGSDNPHYNRIKKNCGFCKREFDTRPSHNGKFCSPQCSTKYRRMLHRIEILCEYCQKEFESIPSAKRKFCSPQCSANYHRGSNHQNYGTHLTEESKQKISQSHKGKKLSNEHKQKIGRHSRKCWGNPEYRKRQLEIDKKRWDVPEYRERMIEIHNTPEQKKRRSEEVKKRWEDPEYRKMQSICAIEQWRDLEYRKKQSEARKKNWQDPIYREKTIKASLKGLMKRPSGLEKQMIELIQKHNLPYKYVGDGSFLIGWKNPDFINTDGQKICIEVRPKTTCPLWSNCSPEEYGKKRMTHFAKWGWKCFVFLMDTLNEKEVLDTLEC